MKKKTFIVASLFAVTLLFFACSSDTDTVSVIDSQLVEDGIITADDEYIDLKEPMTKEIKLQRMKASGRRIIHNLKIVDGKFSLDHTSAEELRVDKDFFEETKGLFERIRNPYHIITSKSGVTTLSTGEGETEPSFDDVYDFILELCTAIGRFNSDLEKDCLWHYYTGGGADFLIDESTWAGIKQYAEKEHGAINPTIDPNDYTDLEDDSINFYGHATYDYALGYATVTFKTNGEAVGLIDLYDFDPGNSMRPEDAELATEIMSVAGIFGTPYYIKYGTKKYESQ